MNQEVPMLDTMNHQVHNVKVMSYFLGQTISASRCENASQICLPHQCCCCFVVVSAVCLQHSVSLYELLKQFILNPKHYSNIFNVQSYPTFTFIKTFSYIPQLQIHNNKRMTSLSYYSLCNKFHESYLSTIYICLVQKLILI